GGPPGFVEAAGQGRFHTKYPGTPLDLCAGMEAQDPTAGAGRDVAQTSRSDAAEELRIRERLIDRVPNPADVEAAVDTRPVVVQHWRRRRWHPHVRRHCRTGEHRRKSHGSE